MPSLLLFNARVVFALLRAELAKAKRVVGRSALAAFHFEFLKGREAARSCARDLQSGQIFQQFPYSR